MGSPNEWIICMVGLVGMVVTFLFGRTVERDAAWRKAEPVVPPIEAHFDVQIKYELPQPLYIRPRDGDRAIFHVPNDISQREAEDACNDWIERFPDVPVMLVIGGVEVARHDAAEDHGDYFDRRHGN